MAPQGDLCCVASLKKAQIRAIGRKMYFLEMPCCNWHGTEAMIDVVEPMMSLDGKRKKY
jgi:hypothetical protein